MTEDADYIRRMMAKVEGMPLAALEQGVDWNWHTFGEYLDRLDGNVGVNAGLPRRPLRAPALRDGRATRSAARPTPSSSTTMVGVLDESIEAGGLGFSTTLSYTHSDGDGQPVALAVGRPR